MMVNVRNECCENQGDIVKKEQAGKSELTNYSVRMKQELIDKCREIAREEEKKVGYPVAVVAIMRKFIVDGIDRWGTE